MQDAADGPRRARNLPRPLTPTNQIRVVFLHDRLTRPYAVCSTRTIRTVATRGRAFSGRPPFIGRVLLLSFVVLAAAGAPAAAQARGSRSQPTPTRSATIPRGEVVRVRPGTALRATPGGDVIGVSSRAIRGAVESSQGSYVRLTVDGFLSARALRFNTDRSRGEVAPANGTSLRASDDAGSAVLAELRAGTFVFPTRAGGRFPAGASGLIPARRALWVDATRLERSPGAAVAAREPATAAPSTAVSSATIAQQEARRDSARRELLRRDSLRRDSVRRDSIARRQDAAGPLLETRGQSALRYGPSGDVVATVPGGVGLTPLARDGGWVRVRIEGWIPDSALQAAGARSAGSLSAADLRADPTGTVGRIVRWRVETLSYQVADALRSGLATNEPYLLARGPGSERAVLYLALPDSLRAAAQALPPLTEITVTARVRNGRSAPAGVPVLELIELSRR